MSVSVCLLIISKTMKLRYKLILMNILIEHLINRSMNLQSRPSPTICRATMRPPRSSSTAECLRLIARLREEQVSAASWDPRPPFEAAEMD